MMKESDTDLRRVVLGIGSNKGDSPGIIREAIRELGEIFQHIRTASFYKSDPIGVTDQVAFLNTAVSGFYSGTPDSLLLILHRIESSYGRNRSMERLWGERTLDIDVLLIGNLIVDSPDLQIPHPRLKERAFALVPLLELEPDAQDPLTGSLYRDILAKLPEQGVRHNAH
jgi:2-amino-4-hydroxy-6-hydroxymethyldihydropteridine diphosphokinase